ncbi:MAG: chorismate synthase [Flavobacteriales bacterium]|nr:chorismate synthase [Flavobacteriales bacterium]
MSANRFGHIFSLTSFGESHGEAIGGIIEGCPAGLIIDTDFIQQELDRRKPGQSSISTQRKESDSVKFLSGIFEGKSTGTPIGFIIPNEDHRSEDYSHNKEVFRPSHADFVYQEKFGIRDYRGGGRSSARETACRVVAGAIAKLILQQEQIQIDAYVSSVGNLELKVPYTGVDLTLKENNAVRCPDPSMAAQMIELIEETRKAGDSLGGIITCVIRGVPAGWGEPVFDKLHADLGKGMLAINAVKGFEYGSGFEGTRMKGSEHNDSFRVQDKKITTSTNFSGGIQGGISNGSDIYFRVAFKPVATIMKDQQTVDANGNETHISGKGRHDPCVVPRAVPIVEAMAAMVLADHYLRSKTNRI